MNYVQRLTSINIRYWLSMAMVVVSLLCFTSPVFATSTSTGSTSGSTSSSSGTVSFGGMAEKVNAIIPNMTTLVASIAYLAGIAFAVIGILKFKQHKDNPQQVTLGVPITLIFVAAGLIFLPTMIKSTSMTLTGSDSAQKGSPEVGSGKGKIYD